MRSPLERLKRLPWMTLFLDALLTALIAAALEFAIVFTAQSSASATAVIMRLLTPPLGLITTIAIGFGVGALAVYLLEKAFPQVRIDAGVLWALVLCLIIAIFIKSQVLPLPLVSSDQWIWMLIGIFTKGRPHWRYWR